MNYSEGFNNQTGIKPPSPEDENLQGEDELFKKIFKDILMRHLGNTVFSGVPGGGMITNAMEGSQNGEMIANTFGMDKKIGKNVGMGLGIFKGFADGGFGGRAY